MQTRRNLFPTVCTKEALKRSVLRRYVALSKESTFAKVVHLRETTYNMGEEVPTENGLKTHITLDTEVANGIKHAVATMDESGSGRVEKSQLQAVVANVCQAIKTPFVSDDLDEYLPKNVDLSVSEFLEFLESKLLLKGKKLNPKELDELSWVVVGQKYDDSPHTLTKKDAFKLWLIFKKLDISGELRVDVEELCIIMEKFVRGIGIQWNEQFLTEYSEDGALTFWKFIECLEQKFLTGVDKSVLREGLQELYDFILDEVTKTGFLTKKGHGMFQSQKSRWFALKPDKLTYYVSSGFREKKGDLVLNNEAKVTSIPDKGGNKYRFMVTCGSTKKEYEQMAPDQRTKQAWITEIQTAIDCFGGETPLKRDLIARKAKRDEDRARKAEEERKRREQDDLLDQQRREIDLLKKRKDEIEKMADEEKAMLDAEIKRREELEELQRNLQQLLEDQKRAREEDEKIRAAKERLLEEERMKREQLEALRLQQQEELQNEKMQKEELMEKQKEQERIMEEERKRLQHLEEERMKAEEAAKAAKDKLDAAETAAKNAAEQAKDRVRQLKTSIGLKGTVGPKVDPLVSHRGKGAFTLEEFLNRATEWSGLPLDEEKPKTLTAPEVDELVKANATPASNQNIPEFLRKAAAWSGLNPETYLESEGKKAAPPPKVAAKPPKPLPASAESQEGKQASQEGEQVSQEGEQVSQEGEQVSQKDEQVSQEGEQVSQEGEQVSQEGEQVSQEGEQVSQEGEQVSQEGEQVSQDGEQVSQEGEQVSQEGEQVSQEGEQVSQEGEHVSQEGEQVSQEDKQVSQEAEQGSPEADAQVSQEGEVKVEGGVDDIDGSEVASIDTGGSQIDNIDNERSTEENVSKEPEVADVDNPGPEIVNDGSDVKSEGSVEPDEKESEGKEEVNRECEEREGSKNDTVDGDNQGSPVKDSPEGDVVDDSVANEEPQAESVVKNSETIDDPTEAGIEEDGLKNDDTEAQNNNPEFNNNEPSNENADAKENTTVVNGQSTEEIETENELANSGNDKLENSEKCAKPDEISTTENVEEINS
ncbi:switch-associated protein 70-like isoform X2 [Dendronephthya gigantea]|uniref:switch-associated protein 70-like isoform X2 n=1 Tax=Dendronephthya gigantea TaxID=151771 RepID=UPI00106DC380|nr:switch-associated protein 70-like isoform X2 [Dendronephthya gigantea]